METKAGDMEAERLIEALKELLKERGVGYRELAEELGVSLPTVKRMLNKSGLPLGRLLELCRIAGVELSEVVARAEQKRPRHVTFSKEQDALFAERPALLSYFTLLAREQKTPLEIEAECGLSRLSSERYLIALERVGLVERGEGLACVVKVRPPFGFGPGSRYLKGKQAQFMEHVTRKVVEGGEGVFSLMKPLRLSESLRSGLAAELMEVLDRYSFFSDRAARGQSRSDGGEMWSLAIALAQTDALPADPIVELDRA